MKALFSFALVCVFFSMSSFTVVKPPVKKAVKVSRTVTSWPITGTHTGYTYAITGSGNTPLFFTVYTNGISQGSFPFYALTGVTGQWEADVPASSAVHANITAVKLGIYVNQEGYTLDFFPDL